MPSLNLLALSALLPFVLAQSPSPGEACTGNVAYCASGSGNSPIILRCSGTSLQPGNCNDNLNEPPLGALCIEASPTDGSAVCSAVGSSTPAFPSATGTIYPSGAPTVTVTTTSTAVVTIPSSVSTPSPSSVSTPSGSALPSNTPFPVQPYEACVGSVAYCASGSGNSPIILRCTGTILQPGNCNDNLNEPPLGALCIDPYFGDAVCSAVGSSAPAFPSVSGTVFPSSSTTTATVTATVTTNLGPSTTPASGGPTATTTATSSVVVVVTTTTTPTASASSSPSVTPFKGAAGSIFDGSNMLVTSAVALLAVMVGVGHIL